jgi:hypothetical protein
MDDVLVDVFSFSSEYGILLLPVVIHSPLRTNSMEEDEVHCLVNRLFSLSYVSIIIISQSNVESQSVTATNCSFLCDSKFRMPTVFYFAGTGAYCNNFLRE